MPVVKLTVKSIEKIKAPDPSGKQSVHWCADLKGFGILVSGAASCGSAGPAGRCRSGRSTRGTEGPTSRDR